MGLDDWKKECSASMSWLECGRTGSVEADLCAYIGSAECARMGVGVAAAGSGRNAFSASEVFASGGGRVLPPPGRLLHPSPTRPPPPPFSHPAASSALLFPPFSCCSRAFTHDCSCCSGFVTFSSISGPQSRLCTSEDSRSLQAIRTGSHCIAPPSLALRLQVQVPESRRL